MPRFGLRSFFFAASAEASGRRKEAMTATTRSERMCEERYAVSPHPVKQIPRFRGCRRASEPRQEAVGVRADATLAVGRILFDDDLVRPDLEERLPLANDHPGLDEHLGDGAGERRQH